MGRSKCISQGLAKFVYQEIGGCESLPTDNLVIHTKPEITFAGSTVLCPGQTSLIVPTYRWYLDEYQPGCGLH